MQSEFDMCCWPALPGRRRHREPHGSAPACAQPKWELKRGLITAAVAMPQHWHAVPSLLRHWVCAGDRPFSGSRAVSHENQGDPGEGAVLFPAVLQVPGRSQAVWSVLARVLQHRKSPESNQQLFPYSPSQHTVPRIQQQLPTPWPVAGLLCLLCTCPAPAAPCPAGLRAGPCRPPWAPDPVPLSASDSHSWILTKNDHPIA